MGRCYKPYYTKSDGKGGRKRVQVKNWYIEYQGADGKTHHDRVGPSKRAAESALAFAQDRETRKRLRLPDLVGEARVSDQPLDTLVGEYVEVLAASGFSERHVDAVEQHLTTIILGCKWYRWRDIDRDALIKWLGKLRKTPFKRPNQKSAGEGRGLSTLNTYIRSAKAFCNWYAEKLKARSPLSKLAPFAERTDRRRSRRILTDTEFARLLEATERAPRRKNTIIGPLDRSALYRVAAYTGLRASELATLTPGHFQLDIETPQVAVEARDAKGKREEPIPLAKHLLEFLRGYLAGKKPKARIWPGEWAKQKRQRAWLARDAKRAGLGEGVLFHGLKRKFVTGLIRSKADPDIVRRLGRHRSHKTTMDYYAESEMPDLKAAVDRLQPPPKPG